MNVSSCFRLKLPKPCRRPTSTLGRVTEWMRYARKCWVVVVMDCSFGRSGMDTGGHDEQLGHEIYHVLVAHHNLNIGVVTENLLKYLGNGNF